MPHRNGFPAVTPQVVLLACAIALPSTVRAEQAPAVARPGERVRVTCPTFSPAKVTGTLVSASEQELVVERDDSRLSLPRDAVVALERSLGRRARRSTRIGGALIGGWGVAGARLSRACACSSLDAAGCCPDESAWDVALDIGSIAAGAAIGFGVGSLFKVERWERAGGPALSLEAAPARGGARVALRLRF